MTVWQIGDRYWGRGGPDSDEADVVTFHAYARVGEYAEDIDYELTDDQCRLIALDAANPRFVAF